MAPIPNHLKRTTVPVDVSSQILTKIGETSNKDLTAVMASTWVAELESNIQSTKDRIQERIKQDLPDFNGHLETSKSVQTRLTNLTSNVNLLEGRLSDSQTGILPPLLRSLKAHNELAQHTSDARVTHDALAFLARCRDAFGALKQVVQQGNLEEGILKADEVATALESVPAAVSRAQIMSDMKNQLRSLRDRIAEQLSEAYSRSISVSSTELQVSHSVQVRQSTNMISLAGIVSSMTEESLNSHLGPLSRDISRYFIDFPLQQPVTPELSDSHTADGTPSVCLSIFPLSPSADSRRPLLLYFKTLFDFLNKHLIPAFPRARAKPTFTNLRALAAVGLLNVTIKGALPASLAGLADFLEFLEEAIDLERTYLLDPEVELDPKHRSPLGYGVLRDWAEDIAEHFGRKRQTDLLSAARILLLSKSNDPTIRVEAPMLVTDSSEDAAQTMVVPSVVPVQGDEDVAGEDDTWDLEGDKPEQKATESNGVAPPTEEKVEDVDAWDFEDESSGQTTLEDDDPWADNTETTKAPSSSNGATASHIANGGQGTHLQPSQCQDDSVWDSVWDEDPVPEEAAPPPVAAAPAKAPKVAKGLEKLTSKAKKSKENGRASPAPSVASSSHLSSSSSPYPASSSTLTSPNPSILPASPRSPLSSSQTIPAPTHKKSNGTLKPTPLPLSQPPQPKEPETCLISCRAQDLVKHTLRILDESASVSETSVFSISCEDAKEAATKAGSILSLAAPSSLALFRALYPVAHASELAHSTRAMRFGNECSYISSEISKELGKARGGKDGVRDQLREEAERVEELGAWWYDEGIEHECTRLSHVLERAEDFVDVGDQERYDACEGVVTEILRAVRSVSNEWKPVLSRTQHLTATGRIVEHALTYVLRAVLALPDIPEVDSRRLAELCRVLAALEGLFIADAPSESGGSNSMVLAFVPSWLKFSYLSELLEASLADLSYLFEQGALIDFSVDELISLVRALFADTPVRSNTIAKLQRGHPQPEAIS